MSGILLASSVYAAAKDILPDTVFSETNKFVGKDSTASDKFGTSVNASDTLMIVGAPYDDDKGVDSGSVHIYEKIPNNYSVAFDGINDYFCIPSTATLALGTGPFTIEAWVYYTTLPATGKSYPIVCNAISGTDNNYYNLTVTDAGTLRFTLRDTASQVTITSTTVMPLNVWHHVAVTRIGSSLILFINGAASGVGSAAKNITQRATVIGAFLYTNFEVYFKGNIYGLRILNTALYQNDFAKPSKPPTPNSSTLLLTCQSEVISDFSNNKFIPIVSGPVTTDALLPFEILEKYYTWHFIQKINSSDGDAGDQFGHSVLVDNNNLIVGSPGNNTNGSVYVYEKQSIQDYSIYFDGNGDYLRCDFSLDSFTTSSSSYTIECWAFPTTTSSGFMFGINRASDGANVLLIGNQIINIATIDYSHPSPSNQWNHYAFVNNNGTGSYYINGVMVRSRAVSSTALSSCVLGIGTEFDASSGGTPGNYFTGYISNIRISSGALYTSNFSLLNSRLTSGPSTKFLTAHTTSIKDDSINNFTINVYGGPTVNTFNPFINFKQKITASDGATGDRFGHSMSLLSDTLVVGAPNDDDKGTDSGSVYVYKNNGTTWTQTQKLTATDGDTGDQFGTSLLLFNNRLFVGAPCDDNNTTDSGSVYVYDYNGTSWIQTQKLTAGDSGINDNFGISFAANNDFLYVGSPKNNNIGAVYEFAKQADSSFSVTDKIVPVDLAVNDNFGTSLIVFDEILIAGAPFSNSTLSDSGSFYIFNYNGSIWEQNEKFTASDGIASGQFGSLITSNSTQVLVSAPNDDDKGTGSGSVYLFEK